jgi:hypothetical protein
MMSRNEIDQATVAPSAPPQETATRARTTSKSFKSTLKRGPKPTDQGKKSAFQASVDYAAQKMLEKRKEEQARKQSKPQKQSSKQVLEKFMNANGYVKRE